MKKVQADVESDTIHNQASMMKLIKGISNQILHCLLKLHQETALFNTRLQLLPIP